MIDALQQPHVQLFMRLLLGGLLLLAGATKLTNRTAMHAAVAEYGVLPHRLERPFAIALPWIETVLGVLLLLGLATTGAAALAVPLFASFTIAIGLNLARGRQFDCHCFGSVQSERIGWPALLRAGALALASLAVALGASRFGALDWALFGAGGEDLPPAVDVVPVVIVAAIAFDALVLLPELLSLQDAFRHFTLARSAPAHAHDNSRRTA